MCGITGIISNEENIINELYESLFNLQHRGQNSSGFITYSNKLKTTNKSKKFGLVDAHLSELPNLQGNMGIAHNRYPTSGETTKKEIQPFFISKPYGISLVHNGNLTNKEYLTQYLIDNNIYIHLNNNNNFINNIDSSSDSEIILNLFYLYIEKDFNKLTDEIIVNAIRKIYNMCTGSFSVLLMINGYGLIAFRDINGVRPLVYTEINKNNKKYFQFASETIALENDYYNNVNNGMIIIINKNLHINKYKYNPYIGPIDNAKNLKPCLFEYIYFARPESYINDILVYNFREKVGQKVIEIIDKNIIEEIDIVVPVPQTSLISATALANKLNKPIKHAIIKNRYTHRTFINKGEEIINNIKKIKVIKELVKNKTILVVDDSIVRGNTSKYIIEELRKSGVYKIYFVSCCPPIKNPNIYGIAIHTCKELIANNKSIDEIQKLLNVDKLFYLPFDMMLRILNKLNPNIQQYEDSVFTGNYCL